MPVAHLPVSPKKPSFPQSSAACHPSQHPASEHPVAAPSVYESHLQHYAILFCHLPAAKVTAAVLPTYGRSLQSTPHFHSPTPFNILFQNRQECILSTQHFMNRLYHRIPQICLLNGWFITFLCSMLHCAFVSIHTSMIRPPHFGHRTRRICFFISCFYSYLHMSYMPISYPLLIGSGDICIGCHFSFHKPHEPRDKWPRNYPCIQISHLQSQSSMSKMVSVHDRKCHGKVRLLHICRINGQKVLYPALVSLRHDSPRLNDCLPSCKLLRCFQQ